MVDGKQIVPLRLSAPPLNFRGGRFLPTEQQTGKLVNQTPSLFSREGWGGYIKLKTLINLSRYSL